MAFLLFVVSQVNFREKKDAGTVLALLYIAG